MGDRVSISFVSPDGEESPALFSHWGGLEFVKTAKRYAKELTKERGEAEMLPLDRLEAGTVMVDFIRWLTFEKDRVESDLYLGKNENDGDNGDNGHHRIKLKK